MAAISKDFVVKNGIVIEGDSEVTSSTNQIDALQVDGGAAIAKNLIVGTTATIFGNVFFNQPLLPLSRDATLGSPDNPFSELYLRGNSLYIDHVVITSTGTDLTVSSTLGSSIIHAGELMLSDITISNSPTTGALQVAGGAGISGNLYVGSNAELQQTLSVTGTSVFYSTVSVAGVASFNNTATATSVGEGAVQVAGGVRINNNLVVMSTASNTGTLETNAVYVEGGVGIKGGLSVKGNVLFKNDVFFQGATTYVYSTNTVYTDNLIELHVPPTGAWTFDDGKDIGFRFHYYNNADWNAALILANDTKKLEFYKNGSEVNGAFVGVYGDFKTGTLQLVGTAASTSTTTGALTVAGGVGIAGNLYVAGGITLGTLNTNGIVYQDSTGKLISQSYVTYNTSTHVLTGTITQANNINGGVRGSILVQSSTSTTTFIEPATGNSQVLLWDPATSLPKWGDSGIIASTASNIAGGYPGAIIYQLTTGSTTFLVGSSSEYMLTYNTGTQAPQWTDPNTYTVGYANTATTSTWASTASYSVYAGSSNFATSSTTSTYAFTSTYADTAFTSTYANISSTATYASIASTATYASISSTATYASIASTATYANTSNYAIVAGTSTYANIAFTATYASIASTATYASISSTATYANIAFTATYANTSNYAIAAGTSTYANIAFTSTYANIAFTSTYANTSNYAIVAGTSTYASTATYAFTATYSSTSTNIAGGATGSIFYQSTTGVTVSLPLGNAGEILTVDSAAPKWVEATGLTAAYANTATVAINANNVRTRSQTASLSYYPTFVADNNVTDNYELLYTTSSFNINPNSGQVNMSGKLVVGGQIWAATSSTLSLLSTEDFSIARSVDPTFGTVYNSLPNGTVWLQTISTRNEKIWLENNKKNTSILFLNYDSKGALNFGDRWFSEQEFISLYPNPSANAFQIKVTSFANFPTSFTTSTWSFDALGNLTAPGKIIVNSTASSTSTTTGALTVVGGVGIQGDVYVGGDIYTKNQKVITTATVNQYASQTAIFAGTDTAVNTSTGNVTIWNTSTLQSVTDRGSITTNTIVINNITSATSTNTGALQVTGGAGIGGDVWIGGQINAVTTSYINGSRILVAGDLATVITTATFITNDPTSQVGLTTIAGTSTVYGSYQFGDVNSIATLSDYNTGTNTGYYSINDAAQQPGYIVYVGWTNVAKFTRFVLNINYTAASGHTIDIDLYNFVTQSWDTFTTYSGTTGWFQFILEVIDATFYLSDGKVYGRLYHVNFGNSSLPHNTKIDYWALQDSIQGGQGPRGATGATGSTGPQGLTTTTTSTFTFTNSTDSASTTTGAVVVTGGVGIGKSLFVGSTASILSTASSTATLQANALYVAGGIGAGSLFVQGPTTFNSSVVFNGTNTYVLTTNTVYTDNILELHYPNNPGNTWAVNDGNDIGFRFHYYDTADRNAFLGRDNATGYLEWLVDAGPDSQSNVTGTNGTFRLGSIILTDTTASSSTATGSLTVVGGVGIGGALYVGQTSYIAGAQILTTATVNQYASQTAIFAGTDTAVNTSTGNVTIWDISTLQSVTGRGSSTTNAVSITNSSASGNTSSGALTVTGGVGIGRGLVVGGTVTATTFVGNLTGTATNIAGGVAGSLPYQSATGTTAFLSIGTNGYVLTSNGSAPIWSAISGLSAGNATTATNLSGGTAGQVPYQTAAGATSFYGPGTTGSILVSSGTNAPVYITTSSIYVGRAVLADTATLANTATTSTNIAGGTAGQVPYQTGAGATSFYGPGTAGNVLVSNGTSAPSYNNTLTLASTTLSTSTTTGALQVRGGVGVADSIYVGNRVGFVGTTSASAVYQYYNTLTNSLDTVFG